MRGMGMLLKRVLSVLLCMLLFVTVIPRISIVAESASDRTWDFNVNGNFGGWNSFNHMTADVTNGSFNASITGVDPYMYSGSLTIDAAKVKYVQVRMKNNTSSTMAQLYWITSSDGVWGSNNKVKTITISANDTGYKTFVFDMSNDPSWNSTVTQIRFDPVSNATGSVNIDYIYMYQGKLAWDFHTNGNYDGWNSFNHMSNLSVSGGYLNANITGQDPYMFSQSGLNAYSAIYNTIAVRMKNSTSSNTAELFWVTNQSAAWDQNKRVTFSITPNDTEYRTYYINLAGNSNWNSVITQIRLDPNTNVSSGAISIDFIELYTNHVNFPLDITKKNDVVSLLYYISQDLGFEQSANQGQIYNITNILKANPSNPSWGPEHAYHYWDEPALGYYRSAVDSVTRTHMQQIADANIDYIVIDNSNARYSWTINKDANGNSYYDRGFTIPAQKFLDILLQMRREGKRTPYVVFFSGTWDDAGEIPDYVPIDTYNRFYSDGKYNELFVRYNGKPLHLVSKVKPATVEQRFTVRKMWALEPVLADGDWTFLDQTPQRVSTYQGINEQMSVTASYQMNHMTMMSAVPRKGGKTLAAQWQRAFQVRPKVLTLNFWNIWSAIRWVDSNMQGYYGSTHFTDSFTREFSHDLEPMKGGHGDLYYQWTKKYVSNYKNQNAFPVLVSGEVDSWKAWNPIYTRSGSGVPAGEPGESLLGLQKLTTSSGASKTPYRGAGYLNILFDTFEAFRFSGGYMSVNYPFATSNFSTTPYIKAAVNFDAAPGADASTVYYAMVRAHTSAPGSFQHRDQEIRVYPGQWNPIVLDISNWAYRNQVQGVEVLFRAQGTGTMCWYGNLQVDWIVRSANNNTYKSSTTGIHNGSIDSSEVVLGDFNN